MRMLYLGLGLLIVGLAGPRAEACSLRPTSVHEQYTKHHQVFLATVRGKAKAPDNAYELAVVETFKGFAADTKLPASIVVTFNIRGQCGFDTPKPGARVLVFQNEGDVVSQSSGSHFIWSESEQKAPHLNPVWDDVILLRAMLNSGPVIPDPETAIHLGLKALLPLLGSEALSKRLPLQAKFVEDAKAHEERIWKVSAKDGAPLVELNKWTGDVIRIAPKG